MMKPLAPSLAAPKCFSVDAAIFNIPSQFFGACFSTSK